MYDLSLLKSFLNKNNYIEFRNYLKDSDFQKEILPILRGIDLWYATNEGNPSLEDVANLTFASGVPEKNQQYIRDVFTTLQNINGTETAKTLLERFKQTSTLGDISLAAYEASRGSKSVLEVFSLVEKLKKPETGEIEYVTDDLDEILEQSVKTPGLRWRLNCLNHSLGSLRKGDFGFIFARPETGKTTFLASEVTFMAGQLKDEDGPILWFNNEEQGHKVKLRCYEAALGANIKQLEKAAERAKIKYAELTKKKIRIFDSASISRGQVEAICQKENPSLILFDQIDKVKGFKADREDLALGAIYQWAREIAKTYCPVIGICQADGTAEGEMWLHMGHVSNAKTAKQAEADFILGIGKSHDMGKEFIRYINISKNKLLGDTDTLPGLRHAKLDVLIEPQIARYRDIGQ